MIEVRSLEYTYPRNPHPTVRGIDFSIQEGEIFGFLGPSGAGKSTTQKVLIRLLKGFSGAVKVLGKPLEEWRDDYYNHIGVGFELPNHYLKLSGLENLKLFAAFYDRPCDDPLELMEKVGLQEDAEKRVSDYSKGMRMRLNFIRAIMHRPEVLFLDEPTAGLDPGNARLIKDIILDLKQQGKTIFVTTHSMQDADELCDRVAFIVDGKIDLIEAPKNLKLKYGRRVVKVEYGNGGRQSAEFEMEGIGQNQQFIEILQKEAIETIHTEEATLEDVFIEVTGKQLT
jgi:fluoroquinolone transport system ATP-binding protein